MVFLKKRYASQKKSESENIRKITIKMTVEVYIEKVSRTST